MRAEFTVPGVPVSGLRGLAYEKKIIAACLAECPELHPDYQGAVVIDIIDYVVCPGLTDTIRRKPRRPALQNLMIMVTRALKDLVYQDREQIVMLSTSRRYGDAAGLEVSISYWDE